MNKDRDIELARYLAGEMSMKEEIAFRKELESEPQQITDLHAMEHTWKHFDKGATQGKRDTRQAWAVLHNRLEKDGLLKDPTIKARHVHMLPVLRVAATVLLIMAIGIPALYFGLIRNRVQSESFSHFAEKGVTTVDLPDGSRVFLNEGAKITCPDSYNEKRSVQLDGEAFFEVMSDPMNPFTVRSGKVVVSVLGTSFNVKPVSQSREVEVYVRTGQVRMSFDRAEKFITLEPGEIGKTNQQDLTKDYLNDPNYLSWKTKEFKFVEADLMEVLQELEESYHVQIHTGKVELSDMKITTSYSEQSIDAILETIGAAFGLTVSLREDGYYLSN
jgi:ferric-dicitrate binding protein FerR (iron transport regulator)